jgi:hypothetical protein
MRPLEVVEQRPGVVAAQVDALANRLVHREEVIAQVGDAQRSLITPPAARGGS